ncbi:MAG: translation initiation factor IF-3 [Acidimicrobiales bacterium]
MDYKKYVYESKQRAKESRKKTTQVVVKEMKYRPKIGGGDFDTKTRKVEKFLEQGHKVKITIMFRGRELSHPQLGRKILDQIAEQMDYLAKIEAYPRLDGRNMTMVLGPDPRKKQQKKAKEANKAVAVQPDASAEAPTAAEAPNAIDAPEAVDVAEAPEVDEASEAE